MTLKEAAKVLKEHLKDDSNFQMIGLKRDSLVVYTFKKPTVKELELNEFEGFDVEWHRLGKIRPAIDN